MLKNYLKIVVLGGVFFFVLEIRAQFKILATPSLEIPLIFDNNPGYNTAFGFKIGSFYEKRKLSIGISVGYQSLSSNKSKSNKVGLSDFQLDNDDPNLSSSYTGLTLSRSCDTCMYTEGYGDLTIIPIMVEWNQYILRREKFKFSVGLNLGVRIFSYSHKITFNQQSEWYNDPHGAEEYYADGTLNPNYPYVLKSINGTITTDKTEVRASLSPKIAFEYLLSKKFSLYLESTVNFIESKTIKESFDDKPKSRIEKKRYIPNNYSIGHVFTTSLGVGVIYNFGHPKNGRKKNDDKKKLMEPEKVEWLLE